MNTILSTMLAPYQKNDFLPKEDAFREVAQQILLASLAQTDFFDHAAFYGGTCLRIFYGLDRYSEDLDFGVLEDNQAFSLTDYLPSVEERFASLGLGMKASVRNKSATTNVESAYLDGPARDILVELFPQDEDVAKIVFNQRIKIKFEVSKNYISGATHEYKTLHLPFFSRVHCYDESSLFAGKIAAVLTRNWKNRVKGRDYYDFAFYVIRKAGINFPYLRSQLINDGFLNETQAFGMDELKAALRAKIESVDFDKAKIDVRPFLKDSSVLDCWSKDYFVSLIDLL